MIYLKKTNWYLDSIISGFLFKYLLLLFGILNGNDAVSYYSEVHQSQWNSNIHTLFMPLTSFGFLVATPAIFKMSKKRANLLQEGVYLFNVGHYLSINLLIGSVFAVIYYFVQEYAKRYYTNNVKTIVAGLTISITSLIIQEVVGHQYGGDEPSRFEGILNAFLYANYYAIANLLS